SRPKRLAEEKKQLPGLLYDLYKGERAAVRMGAARQIGSFREARQEAVAGMLDGLKDKHWGVREAVVLALASFGPAAAAALPQLEQLTADPAPEVQDAVRT